MEILSHELIPIKKVSGLAALTFEAALGTSLYLRRILLCGPKDGLEHRHFLEKLLPATKKGDELFSARSKVLPDFVKGGTESLCRGEATKA